MTSLSRPLARFHSVTMRLRTRMHASCLTASCAECWSSSSSAAPPPAPARMPFKDCSALRMSRESVPWSRSMHASAVVVTGSMRWVSRSGLCAIKQRTRCANDSSFHSSNAQLESWRILLLELSLQVYCVYAAAHYSGWEQIQLRNQKNFKFHGRFAAINNNTTIILLALTVLYHFTF